MRTGKIMSKSQLRKEKKHGMWRNGCELEKHILKKCKHYEDVEKNYYNTETIEIVQLRKIIAKVNDGSEHEGHQETRNPESNPERRTRGFPFKIKM